MTEGEIGIFVLAVRIQRLLDQLEPKEFVPHYTQISKDRIKLLEKNFKIDHKTHEEIPLIEFKGENAVLNLYDYLNSHYYQWPKKKNADEIRQEIIESLEKFLTNLEEE